MNTKHKHLIAEILPGALFIGLIAYIYFKSHAGQFSMLVTARSVNLIVSSGIAFVAALLVGNFLDAVRNVMEEYLWDKLYPLNWDFFFEEPYTKVQQLEDYYFSYFKFDCNICYCIILFFVLEGMSMMFPFNVCVCVLPWYINPALLIIGLVFALDARSLRKEMRRLMKSKIPEQIA